MRLGFPSTRVFSHPNLALHQPTETMASVYVILNRGYGRVILFVLLRGVDRNEIT
jgi:hypothetical protein